MIKNNIFYDPLMHVIYFDGEASCQGVDIGYNLIFRSDGMAASGTPFPNDLWNLNPLFVNPAADDFHLQAVSPAINAAWGYRTS